MLQIWSAQLKTLLQAICKMYGIIFDIHIVKQQEVVTYRSVYDQEHDFYENCP